MQIAVFPTVFVGIGGTGNMVISKLRERLSQRLGTPDLPFYRFLYLDTQMDAVQGAITGLEGEAAKWSAANVISPASQTLDRIQNQTLDSGAIARSLDANSWLDQTARNQLTSVNYSQGVNGRRMFSRLGFLASSNLGNLEQTLIEFYNSLIVSQRLQGRRMSGIEPPYLDVIPTYVENLVRFVAVSSSGGGTGSGCIIDFGYLLRKLRRDNNWSGIQQVGYVALARQGIENDIQQRNTAALLTELDYYCDRDTPHAYRASYLNLSKTPSYETSDPPYDATYVLSANQGSKPLEADRQKAFEKLISKIAEHLLADSVAVFDNKTSADLVTLPRSGEVGITAFLGDLGQNPSGLMTCGVSCREWPAAMVHRHLYSVAIDRLAETWTKTQPEESARWVETWRGILGIPSDATQDNGDVRLPREDKLKDLLFAPFNGMDPVEQLKRLENLAFDEKGRPETAKLENILNLIQQNFQVRRGEPDANHPGVIYAILQTNLGRAMQMKDPNSLPRKIADELMNLCLKNQAGPATAVNAADSLLAVMQKERLFIDECLDSLKPARPSSPKLTDECWQYANDNLLQCMLQSKRAIYDALDPWIRSLRKRFANLTIYIDSWSRQLPSDFIVTSADQESIELPARELQRLENALEGQLSFPLTDLDREQPDPLTGQNRPGLVMALKDLIARGLPEKQANGEPTLFAAGPPMNRGNIDFSYLHQLEAAIFRAIPENDDTNPYKVEILTLLQEESARAQIPIPRLFAESELLLNFNPGATDYAQLIWGANPTRIWEIWNPNQAGKTAFQAAQAGGSWLDNWKAVGAPRIINVFDAVTKGLNPYVVMYVNDRTSIRTQFIAGYDYESRRNLTNRKDVLTPYSDSRIYLPPDPARVRQARRLFLGSILLNRWVYLGGDQPFHEFTYTSSNKEGYAITRRFLASQDMRTAAEKLAENDETIDKLEAAVYDFVDQQGGAASNALEDAKDAINQEILANKKPTGPLLRWNLHDVSYEQATGDIFLFASAYKIRLPKLDHPYAVFLGLNETLPNGKPAPQDGFYCIKCNHTFGQSMPPRDGECPECHHPRPDRDKMGKETP